jgi:FtsZ-binding cell division protein ZapB
VADPNEQFRRLEEKLLKAIEIFKQTQAEKRVLEQQLQKIKLETKDRAQQVGGLERELIALRREREEVRERIQKLLERIEVLTSLDSGG